MSARGLVVGTLAALILATTAAGQQPAAGAPRATLSDLSLVGAGGQPRSKVRYTPPVGSVQSVTLIVSIDGGQDVQNKPEATIHTPELTLKLLVTADDVMDAGGYQYRAEISGAEARARPGCRPEVLQRFTDYCTKLAGIQLKFSATPRGQLHAMNTELPPADFPEVSMLSSQMSSILAGLVCRVPNDDIGPGARWRVTTPFGPEGHTTSHVQELELSRIDKGVYSIRDAAAVKAEAIPKSASDPSANESVTINDAEQSSHMSFQVHPPYLMPAQAEGKVVQGLDMVRTRPDGKSERVKQRITIHLRCTSKPTAEPK